VASPTCSPLRRSAAWISWALQKPGRLSSAAARACACRVPRARVRVRTGSSGCGIVTVARYNVHPAAPNARCRRGLPPISRRDPEGGDLIGSRASAAARALSRFGTFTGLRTIRSAALNSALAQTITDQFFPALDTWTFYGSAYTSKYLTFVPVETRSSVLVSRNADPLKKTSYTVLQRLTPAEQTIFARYDNLRAVPFTDFGNKYALTGSSFDPTVLEHETWSQIAAELEHPGGIRGRSILGAVNYITAALCRLTGDQPATACTPAVRSLLPGD
jgi:hypothetical protein